MKKIMLILVAAMQFSIALGAPIKMPAKDELQKRLDSIAMTHFAEKTNIIEKLANQKMEPLRVSTAIELSISDYFEDLKQSMPAPRLQMAQAQMMMHKPLIFEALLKDEPAALKELEEYGVYQPIKKSH